MSLERDPSDFIDGDYQTSRQAGALGGGRPPSRDEVENKVTDLQSEVVRLRKLQEQLERERAALEETRRRQTEWQTGRAEIIQNLTRGVALLEEAEFSRRQEAEQMAKALAGLKDVMGKVQAINEESWTQENFQVELTRALTAIENARMEYNSARLKFPLLSNPAPAAAAENGNGSPAEPPAPQWSELDFISLCRLGLAFTWPIALTGMGILLVLLLRSR